MLKRGKKKTWKDVETEHSDVLFCVFFFWGGGEEWKRKRMHFISSAILKSLHHDFLLRQGKLVLNCNAIRPHLKQKLTCSQRDNLW